MKILKYTLRTIVNHGTEEDPQINEVFYNVTMPWSVTNEEIAKREAYNGEYEIFDDGTPDPKEQPTPIDIIEAQVTYTAMMTDTLLEV